MNRIQKRAFIRNMGSDKGLRKKHTKGAFGRPPKFEMEDRKRKLDKKQAKTPNITQTIENKEVIQESPKS